MKTKRVVGMMLATTLASITLSAEVTQREQQVEAQHTDQASAEENTEVEREATTAVEVLSAVEQVAEAFLEAAAEE